MPVLMTKERWVSVDYFHGGSQFFNIADSYEKVYRRPFETATVRECAHPEVTWDITELCGLVKEFKNVGEQLVLHTARKAAWRALYAFECRYPTDTRLRQAMELADRWASDPTSVEKQALADAAYIVCKMAVKLPSNESECVSACWAVWCLVDCISHTDDGLVFPKATATLGHTLFIFARQGLSDLERKAQREDILEMLSRIESGCYTGNSL